MSTNDNDQRATSWPPCAARWLLSTQRTTRPGHKKEVHVLALITPEYKPPAFDYSNGLCYILPRMASTSISVTNIRFAHLIRRTLEQRVGRILWSASIRLPPPELVFARASLHLARVELEMISSLFPLTGPSWQMTLPPVWHILPLPPARKPPQQYSPLAALGDSMQVGLPPVWPTWQLMRPMHFMLLSTPAMDHLILLTLMLWLGAELHHRKRNIDFDLQVPKISIYLRLLPETMMAAITVFGKSNQPATTLPGSHL
eukprot:6209449-Pleurochrysis_carterae.AAC.1